MKTKPARRNEIRLSRNQQTWIYATFALLFFSGILWIVADTLLGSENNFGFQKSPVEPLSLRVHGAAAMAFLILLGSLLPGHMQGGWIAKKNHRNGIFFVTLNAALIVTGYGLYYASEESLRLCAHWIHLVAGIAVAPALAWHVVSGRKWGKRRDKSST